MTRIALLRHGPTEWNAEGRLQGRRDLPLSEAGRATLSGCRVPDAYRHRRWYVSPLLRARETAQLLGLDATMAPAVIEMNWGVYEGHTLAELRDRYGEAFTANEARGLDLLPPGGESPRQVQQRVQNWLRDIAAAGIDAGAVTHKGVIRAILALAYDWPMLGKPPVKLKWTCLQDFEISSNGHPSPVALNIPLE
ncbi:histidine phosphatase family protein [uncultured Ferrovibrio sp.]|jgi:broad specificity phosphatase PhoE|uniref:histidine phosphatase family protein n=1 Tax=uncultured Ferrovibrio sp. TaxID=1576913 RepID=UPI002637E95E|nr:histidine phosphatase family protein [uncultured Ferrovibrio sp.]